MKNIRPTIMEVDLDAFTYNINKIKEYVGTNKEIMPVIKANAYGTYINKRIDIVSKFDIVAVAITDEAVELRNLGYNHDIFILNQPYIDELDQIIEYNITFGLSSDEFLDQLLKIKTPIKVHLEIETGMNRTGINLSDLKEFIKKIKLNDNIIVEGVYTHLSSADNDDEYTQEQLDVFTKALQIVKDNFDTIKYIHTSASNGLLNYKENITNLVRPGLTMYGYESFNGLNNLIDLKPICKLKSKITFLKEVEEGASISYSRSYKTPKKMKVATIPLGYADGLRRTLSNRGQVLIHNTKVPIIGKICMDGFMVDVTTLENVKVGDDVYIWDNNQITLDEIADSCDTINYEIMSTISYRVPRIFNDKENN